MDAQLEPAALAVVGNRGRRGVGHFFRHLGEMTLAMMLGMAVLGGLTRLALTGLGLDVDRAELQLPALLALVMAFNMSVPMAWWMRRRRHSWGYTAEMVAAMFVPVLALIPLLWLGFISGDTLSMVQHAVMLPSMALVMLRRRGEVAR